MKKCSSFRKMHYITVIVHLTLGTIEIEIVISLSHIRDEHLHLFLVGKIITYHYSNCSEKKAGEQIK